MESPELRRNEVYSEPARDKKTYHNVTGNF